MPGATNYVLSDVNNTNDKNTTVLSSSLSIDAVAVAVALPWVRFIYSMAISIVPYAG